MTGSTHANHRSARRPRRTLEGPARDNPIAGPRTAGVSGRHNEPGSRQASACPAQPPSKSGGASPWGGKRHLGVRKADRSTESDRMKRGAAHHACPRGTPERHAASHNGQVPSNNGRRVPQTRRARTTRNEPRYKNRCQATPAAVRTDVCGPGSEPSPCRLRNSRRSDGRVRARQRTKPLPAKKQPPSGWMSARPGGTQPLPATNSPAATPRTPNTAHAPQPTAQHTERAHRWTGAKWPRTPHTQHNKPSKHTGEQEPSGPGRRTPNTTDRAGTPMNGSPEAQDTARGTQQTERAHR